MREILFRAKAINRDPNYEYRTDYQNGDWVYGLITKLYDERFPDLPAEMSNEDGVTGIEIDYRTTGQYTGLTDKNGAKIFEGDIVKNEWCFIKGNSIVRFDEYKSRDSSNDYQCGHLGFYLEHISDFNKRTVRKDIMYFANKCEIIGNIFDNPELLRSDTE